MLAIPYYPSMKDTDCGPLALQMVLEYYGIRKSFNEIACEEKQLTSGLVWSVGIARAARIFGCEVSLISKSNYDFANNDIDYYKQYADDTGKELLIDISKELGKIGVNIIEKDMSLEELLSFLSKGTIPIVLINWYVISGRSGYSGHFVPVVGYDNDYVYIHNPGLLNAMAYMPIRKDMFLNAWESEGTDKDAIVIGKDK